MIAVETVEGDIRALIFQLTEEEEEEELTAEQEEVNAAAQADIK